MQRETRDRLLEVIAAGAICVLGVSPAVAGGDKSSTGTQMDKSSTGTQMDKSGTSTQMNKSGTSEQGVSGQGMSASSSKVRRAQEALKSEGHDPGPIDGVMGPRTQQALRQYQREENLKETGRLDQDTMSKLGV
jgi:peptidoglycan hydrolase-like protein with peptidoglycan-binding domain